MTTEIITLSTLAQRINETNRNAEESAKKAIFYAIECGDALIDAKALVKHGEWLTWLKTNCEVSERTAQNYMKLAKLEDSKAQRVADLSIREAIKLLSNPKEIAVVETKQLQPIENYFTKNFRGSMQIWHDLFRTSVALLHGMKKTPDEIAKLTGYSIESVMQAINPKLKQFTANNEGRAFMDVIYEAAHCLLYSTKADDYERAEHWIDALKEKGFALPDDLKARLSMFKDHYQALSDSYDSFVIITKTANEQSYHTASYVSFLLFRDAIGLERLEAHDTYFYWVTLEIEALKAFEDYQQKAA